MFDQPLFVSLNDLASKGKRLFQSTANTLDTGAKRFVAGGVPGLFSGETPQTYGQALRQGIANRGATLSRQFGTREGIIETAGGFAGGGNAAKKGVDTAVQAVAPRVFKGFDDLSTKLLERLKGRSTVSRQFIEDMTNSPDLKQPERDLIRKALEDFAGENEINGAGKLVAKDQINVPDFANKVKGELLPLNLRDDVAEFADSAEEYKPSYMYENITLPSELRGPVANYAERVYESPISTSAGDVHNFDTSNYFAHTRIEDLPAYKDGSPDFDGGGFDGETRRVIEIQSDLFQKGRLENEGGVLNAGEEAALRGERTINIDGVERSNFYEHTLEQANQRLARQKELAPLEPYRNTWHERVIREEVKQAALDGKTKLQFPTGETAMKIEGLGETARWYGGPAFADIPLKPDDLKVGREVAQSQYGDNNTWIITDVLGDGKFKAVPKRYADQELKAGASLDEINSMDGVEQFDISGKVDTENPIYQFYDKRVRKYLANKYGAKEITDPQGVKWMEIDVKPEQARLPVEAFAAAPLVLPQEDRRFKSKPVDSESLFVTTPQVLR